MSWNMKDPEAGTDVADVSGKRRGEGYDLYKPGPVPIGESPAGPFPGLPDLANKADDLN